MVKHHDECGMSGDGVLCTCPRGWPRDEHGNEIPWPNPKSEVADTLLGASNDDLDMIDDVIQDIYDVRMPKEKRRQLLGVQRLPLPVNGYLPFPRAPSSIAGWSGASWTISACPQLPFRPEVLITWGYDEETMITMVTIGQRIQGAATAGELPASFFGTARTYEKILEDLKVNGISTPSWLKFDTLYVGQNASISGYGKLRNAVMLGKMIY